MQLIVYILVYPFLWFISILPFKLLYLFSDFLYLLIYKILGYRTKTVKENLKLIFPNKSRKEITLITKKFYEHLCDMIVEAIKSMTISRTELQRRFEFTNLEVIQELESKNRSIVLMCSHYASWEWIFALQTHVSYSGYAIYKRLSNRYFDRLVKRIRARHNSFLITTKETFRVMNRVQQTKELAIYGFAADQSPKVKKAQHWNEFMGIKVPVYTGAELLAKKYDLSVVFLDVKLRKRGFYMAEFTVLTEDPKSISDYALTDRFYKLVEAQILKAPEYYLWTHKRWKHKDSVPEKFM